MSAFVSLTKSIRVIDRWVWFRLSNMHSCHWPKAFVSLTTECDLDSVACIRVIDHKHSCHWPFSIKGTPRMCVGIRVIDQSIRVIDCWVWFRLSNLHSWHWPNAFVSLTIPYKRHSEDVCRHSCHWPKAFVSLTTECDLDSVTCIRVIDQKHSCHWPFPIKGTPRMCVGIRVIDQKHSCHWPLSVI